MAGGLLNQQQPAAQMGGEMSQREENASPEEQAAYDRFVANGMKVLYNPKAAPKILEAIKGGGNPVEGLANALTMLVMRLEDSAKENGDEISEDVKLHAGTELLEQMADLAEAAKIHKFDEKELESAMYLAMDQYRSTRQQQGALPMDEINANMQTAVQADQQGKIEDLIPGITEYAKKAPTPDELSRQGK